MKKQKLIPIIIILIIFIFTIFLLLFWKIFQKNASYSTISEKDIVKILKSDSNIFTEWLYKIDNSENFMISGWGAKDFPYTESVFGILDSDGNFTKKWEADKFTYFGEGIAEFDGKIFWTFWKNKAIFVFDKNFSKISEFSTPNNTEGWGLTANEKYLILSDGTEFLTFFNKNFQQIKKIRVTENWIPIKKINELEYINGKIFANIWLTNDIIVIDVENGNVLNRINLDAIKAQEMKQNTNAQEMNGIAYDEEKNEVIITGKLWKHLYTFDKKIFEK